MMARLSDHLEHLNEYAKASCTSDLVQTVELFTVLAVLSQLSLGRPLPAFMEICWIFVEKRGMSL